MSTKALGRSHLIHLGATIALILCLSACSLLSRPWGKVDEYVQGLRCGMSREEVESYTEQFPALEIWDPDRSDEFSVAREGNTVVSLWFSANTLIQYQISWTFPVTNFDSRPKVDLCSDTRSVTLNLEGGQHLSGATVWLNDERVGTLSSSGSLLYDVPLGTYRIRVEKTEEERCWVNVLQYDESSPGHDRLEIEILNGGEDCEMSLRATSSDKV